ncbi:MAG TPA: hypothetical protein VIF12_06645 [Micavibrio sp.]|jgi:hypothetical protein
MEEVVAIGAGAADASTVFVPPFLALSTPSTNSFKATSDNMIAMFNSPLLCL